MDYLNTPILFLIFNRPDTTEKVFNVIRQVKPKRLFIAADGPRLDKVGERELCEKSREIINKIDWDCEVKTLFRDYNLGCGKAVSSAITWFFENVEEGVILEDDCLPNLDFFYYCQQMLEKYREKKEVMVIAGSNLNGQKTIERDSYYFSAYAYVWGWATWKRSWNKYDFYLKDIREDEFENIIKNYFYYNPQINYWKKIFKKMKSNNPVDTWDYQLNFSIWKNKGFSIVPNINLVSNIGFGREATHTINKRSIAANSPSFGILPIKHPSKVFIDQYADKNYFSLFISPPFIRKFLRKILQIITI